MQMTDPWGKSFGYISPGWYNTEGFDLWSCGPNGLSEHVNPYSDDIRNW